MKKKLLNIGERKCACCSHDENGHTACEASNAATCAVGHSGLVNGHPHGKEDSHGHTHGEEGHSHGEEDEGGFPVRLVVGAAVFAIAFWLSNAFALPWWGVLLLYGAAYVILGVEVLFTAVKNLTRGQVFDENFLMTVATVGAFILGDYAEGAAVMLFYLIGETLSDVAVAKSRRSITSLMDIRPDYANIEQNGKIEKVPPQDVSVGQTIVIEPFEKVPLDGTVLSGNSAMNTAALTGESVPRDVSAGSAVLAGFVNGQGRVTVRVDKPFGETTASKILDIVQNASSKKAASEKFITKFARVYTPIVCAAALAVALIPSLITGEWALWVSRALIFLVISCPCALVVSVPLSYFGGIGGASKNGILIKGAVYIDKLTGVREVVFDKTGTLTKGVFEVRDIDPANGVSKEDLLYLAACVECRSNHPIAKSVLAAYGRDIDESQIKDYAETPGFGVKTQYGADTLIAGSAKWMKEHNVSFTPAKEPGTVLYAAKNGTYLGYILISDVIKQDAAKSIAELKAMGIDAAMLTGDNSAVADAVAAQIGIGAVYSELLPQDKVSIVEKIEEQTKSCAFVGDGVNDAPVLTVADVGIAMGALGSDAAIEAADVVLMTDEPKKVPLSIKISKKTKRIVWQNIVFALSVKAVVMVLGVLGVAGMEAAVFADVGVTLLAVLNALRALKAPA